jgi:DNA-binding PadR family transcriptional regulator
MLRKPQTVYHITERGRRALTEYVQAFRQLLGVPVDAKSTPRHRPS